MEDKRNGWLSSQLYIFMVVDVPNGHMFTSLHGKIEHRIWIKSPYN